MKKNNSLALITALFFLLILVVLLCYFFVNIEIEEEAKVTEEKTVTDDSGKSQVVRYDKGYRFDQNGWIYVHIEGEPYERGKQHGYLVAKELATIKKSLEYLTYQNTGMTWDYFVDAGQEIFYGQANAKTQELLQEIKGIADGAQEAGTDISWQEIFAWNTYEEMTGYWWPTEQEKVYQTLPSQIDKSHCSAFMATGSITKDGKIVLGHNSWDEFATGQFDNLILDIEPSEGHHIFMQSIAGYIDSMTDFYVSDAGLVGTETTMGGFNVYKTGELPEAFRVRMAMQYSDNFDDFIEYMRERNSGGYANTWLLGNINSNEIMQYELGLKFENIEKKADGYFIGANYPHDPRIRNLESEDTGYRDIRRHQGARQVRLEQLMEKYKGKIDVEVGKTILGDHYDVYLNTENNPSSRTVDGHYELDPRQYMSDPTRPIPYQPRGTVDGKVMDAQLASNLSFVARFGNSSGIPFDAEAFLDEHPQWNDLKGYLFDRPTQPWTLFRAGE